MADNNSPVLQDFQDYRHPLSDIDNDDGFVYHRVVSLDADHARGLVDPQTGYPTGEVGDLDVWTLFELPSTPQRGPGVIVQAMCWRSSWCLGELLRRARRNAKGNLSYNEGYPPVQGRGLDIGEGGMSGWRGPLGAHPRPLENQLDICVEQKMVRVVLPGMFYATH
jgi:hypothetical protein